MYYVLWLLVVGLLVFSVGQYIRQRDVNLFLARRLDKLSEELFAQTERGDRTAWRLKNVEHKSDFTSYADRWY